MDTVAFTLRSTAGKGQTRRIDLTGGVMSNGAGGAQLRPHHISPKCLHEVDALQGNI